MNHIAGRIKGLIMLTMLLLIATRLTWLQTSENKLDISASFYRTGLWFNQYVRSHCAVSPEATFPLPAEMAVRSDAVPPPPTQGQLSPGLASIMMSRCQFVRMDVDDFSHWNPWIFMSTALFVALFTRLIASSWTAGLIAAVAVLSRGTVQGRATLAAAEPFAAAAMSAAWVFGALFVRSLWSGWIVGAILCWCVSMVFVPSLWISSASWILIFALCWLRSRKSASSNFSAPYHPISSTAVATLASARSPRFWALVVMVSSTVSLLTLLGIHNTMPGALDDLHLLLHNPLAIDSRTMWDILWDQMFVYSRDVDYHALAALIFISAHPGSDGRFGSFGRSAALGFFFVITMQVLGSLLVEGLGAATLAGLPASVVPSVRTMELPLIAWGTASFWRILDGITGYRLSSSGWSIRGRVTIKQ